MRERYLKRRTLRSFELMLQSVYFQEVKAVKHRKGRLLNAMRMVSFFKKRERSMVHLQQ